MSLLFPLKKKNHGFFPVLTFEPLHICGNTEEKVSVSAIPHSGLNHCKSQMKCAWCCCLGRFKWCFRLCAHSFYSRCTLLWLENNCIWPSHYIIIKQLKCARGIVQRLMTEQEKLPQCITRAGSQPFQCSFWAVLLLLSEPVLVLKR